jgi:hypothetical protein
MSAIITAVVKACARDLIAAQSGPVRAALEAEHPASKREGWGLDEWVWCLFDAGRIAMEEASRAGS